MTEAAAHCRNCGRKLRAGGTLKPRCHRCRPLRAKRSPTRKPAPTDAECLTLTIRDLERIIHQKREEIYDLEEAKLLLEEMATGEEKQDV